MRDASLNTVIELFGCSAESDRRDWVRIVRNQHCPFLGKTCYKVRKSDPATSIGSCTVLCGRQQQPIVICPPRFLERSQVFIDCFHLLTTHEPGNELHIVQEIRIPGGSVDYFVASARKGRVRDFVGVEIQALDTTGTVWPARQRLLKNLGVPRRDKEEQAAKSFGVNWKMTAKTILVQMHHKIQTFEHVNKKLVLVLQDKLLDYMTREFRFEHVNVPAALGDSIHMHAYRLEKQPDRSFKLGMQSRMSTDSDGIAACLGLQADARVELAQIVEALEAKLSPETLFDPV